jgi:hypothetical protein
MSRSKKAKEPSSIPSSDQNEDDFSYLLTEEKTKYEFILRRLPELEKGDALLLKRIANGKIIYDPKAKLFYHFDKHHWIPDTPYAHRLRKIISEKLAMQYKYAASDLVQRDRNSSDRTKLLIVALIG